MTSPELPGPSARRTQAERRAATRAALVGAAREHFLEHGYADVSAEEIVRAAGVTRGALYHHFGGKEELFAEVFEAVETDLVGRLEGVIAASGAAGAIDALSAGVDALLEMALDGGLVRLTLVDAPVVLGWTRWREVALGHGLGLIDAGLAQAMQAGEIPRGPVRPLAHLLLGAIDEAVLYVSRAADPAAARDEMSSALRRLLAGLRARSPDRVPS